jgi:hypothetical protein
MKSRAGQWSPNQRVQASLIGFPLIECCSPVGRHFPAGGEKSKGSGLEESKGSGLFDGSVEVSLGRKNQRGQASLMVAWRFLWVSKSLRHPTRLLVGDRS